MRSWKRYYRAKRKDAYAAWLNSGSANHSPKLKLTIKRNKYFVKMRNTRLEFVRKEIISKEYYEDCAYHPCKITFIDMEDDDIRGKSLVDGTEPRACSLFHCGVIFFTESEALERLELIRAVGMDEYIKAQRCMAE